MTNPIRRSGTVLFAFAVLALVAATPGLHFELDRSEPTAEAEVASPDAIKLWFTQVPQARSTSIRLLDAEGALVPTEDVVQDADDGTLQSTRVQGPLDPGSYTVAWRAMAADGHVVRDDFTFTVTQADTR